MTRKSKRIMARILAVVLAVTLVPSNMWGTAGVVMAEETSETFTEEDADVSTDDVQERKEEAGEKETSEPSVVVDDGKDSDSAPVDAEETLEDDKDADVKEDKKETITDKESESSALVGADQEVEDDKGTEATEDKKEIENISSEADNKDAVAHVHNFTLDYSSNDTFFRISGNLNSNDLTEVTYTDHTGASLKLTKTLKIESATSITFNAENSGNLILITEAARKTKVDGTDYTSNEQGINTIELGAGEHTIKKGTSGAQNLYYIAFLTTPKETVAAPTATPVTGEEVTVGSKIKLSCTTNDAVIHYTTDGTDPKESSSTYTGEITVAGSMVIDRKVTIKAYATKTGCNDSETAIFSYTVAKAEDQLLEPTADPEEGAVAKGTTVALKSDEAGVSIYYTTDGTMPSESSEMLYREPIEITEDMTIKAIATKEGYIASFPATFAYTIKKPTIKVDPDTFVVSSVEINGDITFTNGTDEVFDISLKAVENIDPADNIKVKAEAAQKEGGRILYYDFLLINNESPSDKVTIAEGSTGMITIKMPYLIASNVNKRNEIVVVNATDEIEINKASDGFLFNVGSIGSYAVVINPAGAVDDIIITKSEGYEEGAYAEWKAVEDVDGYMAYVAPAGGKYTRIDDELIREYADHWRVDVVGLAKGTYYIKIDAVVLNEEDGEKTATIISSNTTNALQVTNYDRSGLAFSRDSQLKSGSGAYNDDGTLRDGAQIIYVTADTAKTCTATVNGATVTGIQTILDAKQATGTSGDILDIRIIGCVAKDDLDHISSDEEGIQVKGKDAYTPMNITIEGIGEDAVVKGFGFLIRNCGNVEFRNFALMAFMDDGISINNENCNIWVHNLDIFYGSTGGDSDQAKGDGSVDLKDNSTYLTIAYNHFWDSGKCSLCGMKSEKDYCVTYHHNWFDHSDSRHPRIRAGSIHVYNNYYDGNSKYGVGITYGGSAFVEANYFRNCKYPMLISQQGSDIAGGSKGTFSGEDGGIIKAYNNVITGGKGIVYANAAFGSNAANPVQFDAYLAGNRDEKVPNTYKAIKGGTSYDNFDTSKDLGVKEEDIDTPENVPAVVMAKSGRLNGGDFDWEFDNATEDTNDGVISALKAEVVNYQTSVKKFGSGVASDVTVVEGGNSNAPGEDSQIVNAPTANIPSGKVEAGTEIILSSSTEGAKIRYTLTGLAPTDEAFIYEKPIVINKDTTIKAIAVLGESKSDTSTFKYTLSGSGSGDDNSDSSKTDIRIINLEPTYPYTGDKITPAFDVIDYNIPGGKLLSLGVDYTVTYKNNKDISTDEKQAEIIIKGKGNYAADKKNEAKATFKIVPADSGASALADLSGAKLKEKIQPQAYSGKNILPSFTLVLNNGTEIEYVENTESSVKGLYKRADKQPMNVNIAVSNNKNKGNATILVTGADDKKVKIKFKITAASLENATIASIPDVDYSPNGAVPPSLTVTVSGINEELKLGRDYTVKYSNNKKAGEKTATVTVTGKGNYTKKAQQTYTIKPASMSNFKVVGVVAHDGIKQIGKIKAAVVNKNNGSALKAKQYTLKFYKELEGTAEFDASDEVTSGMIIYVAAVANDSDNLKGDVETNRTKVTVGKDISKAKFKIAQDYKKGIAYTGKEIELEAKHFEAVTYKDEPNLVMSTNGVDGDYVIVSYANNINKGTATAVIQGIGKYGGTKTIKFKIKQQTISKVELLETTKMFINSLNGLLN